MAVNVMRQIDELYDSFTPSFKKVAGYLREHREEAQYLSISELADECEVGKATVSRFCAALGFDGYSRLRLALARSVLDDPPVSVRSAELINPSAPSAMLLREHIDAGGERGDGQWPKISSAQLRPYAERARACLEANVAVMEQTLTLIDYAALARSAQILAGAREVYCLGHGSCQNIAADAWSFFLTVSPKFHNVTDSHLQIMTASQLDEGSAILFVSFLGVTRDAADVLGPARKRGAKVILISRYINSPAAEYADEVIACGGRESSIEGGSFLAKTSMLFAIDLLAGEYCRLCEDSVRSGRELTSEALAVRLL